MARNAAAGVIAVGSADVNGDADADAVGTDANAAAGADKLATARVGWVSWAAILGKFAGKDDSVREAAASEAADRWTACAAAARGDLSMDPPFGDAFARRERSMAGEPEEWVEAVVRGPVSSPVLVSALAKPDPVARAAPTPRLNAPAFSQE